MLRKTVNLLLILVFSLSLSSAGFAQSGGFQPQPGELTPDSVFTIPTSKGLAAAPLSVARATQSSEPSAARIDPSQLKLVSVIVAFDESVDASTIAALTGGQVIHNYEKVFNGASLIVSGDQVANLAALPGVKAVYLDELLQPETEVSPGFIGAPALWGQLGGQESAGEGVTVGIIDSGIWPEHPSFSDPDPSGKPFAPPATLPGSNGFGAGGPRDTCDFGDAAYNPNDADFNCNNKLIGAYDFLDTYKTVIGLLPEEFDSARDDNGHGTHTASTAAGNGAVAATLLGVPRGLVSGIAPRAHVIAYRVCGDEGCFSSDSVAAVEQAILDDVDAINFSISGGNNPYADAVSLAFLAAYDNGVFVAASAGNSGPTAETVAHREPWVTTVAASNSNRFFLSTVSLAADNGDTLELVGASVTDGIAASTPVILAPAAQFQCNTPFAPGTFNGEIVICARGVTSRVEKSYNVAAGGASGLLLYNVTLQGLATDNHFIPSVHLENDAGALLLAFMSGHTGVTGVFTPGTATTVQGDVMAAFSSRGGPNQQLGISKPDVTAPGVQILAGQTPMPATVVGGQPGELFQSIQGTSMSSPHVAGSGALIKALHPDWTPGQIKSALMTTAFGGVFSEDGVTPTTPFDDGSGRVDLSKAGDPGLTFDTTGASYLALQDELWNSNYPSLYVPALPGKITVSRTVTSVLSKPSKWALRVESPADLKVSVPRLIGIAPHGTASFNISLDASLVPLGETRHATLFLSSEGRNLVFPITIVRRQSNIVFEKTCDPAEITVQGRTNCAITASNTTFEDASVSIVDNLPRGLTLVNGTVNGATQVGSKKLTFNGVLQGAEPPVVTLGPGLSAAGYLPLSGFGIAPVAGVGDETIINYTVPAFEYAGISYNRVGFVSNGYLVVGGGTGADVEYINQNLPDPDQPNNVLAPFWTDLNPPAGGALRIGILTDGVRRWVIFDWEAVQNYGDGQPNSFQVWIGINGVEDISFAYGDVSGGDSGFLTVGAENSFGNTGQNVYFNGVGVAPANGTELVVSSIPGLPGETHTITFSAAGLMAGAWTNCADMTSDLFQGVSSACFTVNVTP